MRGGKSLLACRLGLDRTRRDERRQGAAEQFVAWRLSWAGPGQEPSLTIEASMAKRQHHRHWSGSGFKGYAGLDLVHAQNASVPLYKLARQRETPTHD